MSPNITRVKPGPKAPSTFRRKGGFPDIRSLPNADYLRLVDHHKHRVSHESVLNDLRREAWDNEIGTEVALLRAKFGTPKPLAEPINSRGRAMARVVYDEQTLEPRLERGRQMCRAQYELQVRQKLREQDRFAFREESRVYSPGIAGQLQQQVETLLSMATHVVRPQDYIDQVVVLGLNLKGDLVPGEFTTSGNLLSGKFRFEDGSELWFDREGTR